jgi:CRISPR-associated protein Cmr2
LGEAFVDESEQLSIPELIKRLITYSDVARQLKDLSETDLPSVEIPERFRDLSQSDHRGWFQGDGDSIGKLLRSMAEAGRDEAQSLNQFSHAMMNWGKTLKHHVTNGRLIYAGGDDFLGVFYNTHSNQPPLTAADCLSWFYQFPDIWRKHDQPITVSVGFVWANANVPQRDVLQHCREAEQSAKKKGRDRLALRVVFSGGNMLEWVCPWWFLQDVLEGYRDRNDVQGSQNKPNWAHIFNDVAALQSRHAFKGNQTDVALGLFEVYFGNKNCATLNHYLWDIDDKAGILGNHAEDCKNVSQTLTDWIVQLARVGFHLYSNS